MTKWDELHAATGRALSSARDTLRAEIAGALEYGEPAWKLRQLTDWLCTIEELLNSEYKEFA